MTTWGDLENTPRRAGEREKVFVVHGWEDRITFAVYDFLNSLGLQPLEWDQAVNLTRDGTPYPGDVLDYALNNTKAVLILLTPDELVSPREELTRDGRDSEPGAQARPNVIFEAGMALAKDSHRTIILEFGKHRPFSDIQGRHLLKMDNSEGRRHELVQRLIATGCSPDTSGNHWMRAGDFSPIVYVEPVEKVSETRGGEGSSIPGVGGETVEQGGISVTVQPPKGSGGGSFVARGRVYNSNAAAKTVSVTATYFDAVGSILGTASGMVSSVGSESSKTIELMSFDDLQSYTSYEAQIDNILH